LKTILNKGEFFGKINLGNIMLTPDQAKNVSDVYRRLEKSEERGWDPIDDTLYILDFLSDHELVIETEILILKHKKGSLGCLAEHEKHPQSECYSNKIMEAAENIVELYKSNSYLPEKSKYILQYYLALTQQELITFKEDSNS
jgi:hypothetical protein